MGRNQKKAPNSQSINNKSNSFSKRYEEKQKPINKNNKDSRKQEITQHPRNQPRQVSQPRISANQPQSNMVRTKPQTKNKGPVDAAKMNQVKEALVDLETLINTYEEVEMDKQTNLKHLIEFIQSKYSKVNKQNE